MESLQREIALNAAEYAVERWGEMLPERKKARLRCRYYDVVLAALRSFEAVANAKAIRARTLASEN